MEREGRGAREAYPGAWTQIIGPIQVSVFQECDPGPSHNFLVTEISFSSRRSRAVKTCKTVFVYCRALDVKVTKVTYMYRLEMLDYQIIIA
jgi:hypothetical protein